MPSNLRNVLETSSDKVTLEQTEPGPVSRTLAVCKNVSKTFSVFVISRLVSEARFRPSVGKGPLAVRNLMSRKEAHTHLKR